MTPFEAFYVRRCRTLMFWEEVEKGHVEGQELVQHASDIIGQIKKRIKTTQDRQASYANVKRIPLQFEDSEIWSQGKLFSRIIGPFEILESVGDLAYRLALLPYLSNIHDVFHVSLLRRYVADESHILQPSKVQLDTDLTYVERLLRILDQKVKMLRTKVIPLVLFQWQNQGTEESIWKLESRIRADYPELF
ncbi:uncharacterized protein [Henckelia pumila]|uniref:uncharacterized protein n=1 Tax=Henckelia pumila TaxID=405737 RepID=UPI003C6DE951